MIPKHKIQEIKNLLDGQSTATILQHIGYEIYRGNKFKLRDENTPSVSIRRDGYIKDFGGDFSGDLISLLREYHDMSFEDAIKYLATCLGVQL